MREQLVPAANWTGSFCCFWEDHAMCSSNC